MAEHQYKEYAYPFVSKGLAARFAIDKTSPEMYWNLLGLEVRQEDALSSRLGRIPITTTPLADTNVHTLSRLKGTSGNTFRYAGAGQSIYRLAGDQSGAYTKVVNAKLSGNRFSSATYRPSFSSFPYIFFADSAVMLKDNGGMNPLQQMGIFPPIFPPIVGLASFSVNVIDPFGDWVFVSRTNIDGVPKTITGLTPVTSAPIANIVRNNNLVTVTTSIAHGLPVSSSSGGQVSITGVIDPSFNGMFGVSQVLSATVFTFRQGSLPNAASSGGNAANFNDFLVNTTISSPATVQVQTISTVTPASMAGIFQFGIVKIGGSATSSFVEVQATTASTFTFFNYAATYQAGDFIKSTPLQGTVSASSSASIQSSTPISLDVLAPLAPNVSGSVPGSDSNIISFLFNLSNVANVTSIQVLFDVGDGSFAHDFYSSTVNLGGVTNNTWAQSSIVRGTFTKNGLAGTTGHTWANVKGYKIIVTTNANGNCIFQMSSFYVYSPTGLNVGAGQPYDYRYTYFNVNTGDESNPSVPMVSISFVSPNNQSAVLTLTPSTDPQVTHINVYRRGGTLNTGWTFVAQVPANSTSYVDGAPDSQIASNQPLAIDNDVPLTTTLPIPVTTNLGTNVPPAASSTVTPGSMANIFPNQQLVIDQGLNSQETVIVQSVTSTQFTAYFQLAHSAGSTVNASARQGTPVNLMTIAFDMAWFAGDPNNPNRLYYSKINNPEATPPQNWIEIGTPADPIMAVVFYSGQLYVKTNSRVWRVIIPFPGATPTPYPTASRQGLVANFAFCIAEGIIPFLSKDGVYIFTGQLSRYSSEVVEWLLADKEPNLGPVPEQDPTQAVNSLMAYYKNEIFLSYLDKAAVQRRLVYDVINNRWRNDDVPATAMFYEEDTKELVIGRNNGMIYRDRRGDVDTEQNGPVPINIILQTGAQDQGFPLHDKVFNEFTLDFDSGGQNINVSLLFDNGSSAVSLGTISSSGRSRIPLPINSGQGRTSQNVVLLITGSVTSPVHFYNWYIKAAVEVEYRDTFDSYWVKQGTDHWKIWKQGWFEYVAPDPAGITFSVYLEGNTTTPAFTFSLASTSVRTAKRVRFPATKAKIRRIVATSPSRFQLYGESFIEWKDITTDSGYQRENLGSMLTAQGSV